MVQMVSVNFVTFVFCRLFCWQLWKCRWYWWFFSSSLSSCQTKYI